jgi:hypothetical protein
VLDNLVYIFFGLSVRVVFQWKPEGQCDMLIIIIFNIENKYNKNTSHTEQKFHRKFTLTVRYSDFSYWFFSHLKL